MKLSVRGAAAVLNVSETKIYRWVDEDEIPFVMIHHQPMFHRIELLEWAMEMELPVRGDMYEYEHDQPFTTALERGGGRMLRDGLAELASDLPIENASERDVIRALIAARETEMFVTRPADWIAIPRARSPIICPNTPAMVTLWWCGHRALVINTVPTNVLFVILAPTIKQHLQLLSRLSLALHAPAFRTAVQRSGAFAQSLAEARHWEQGIEAALPADQGALR